MKNSDYAVGLETDEGDLEQDFDNEESQTSYSSSATKGKISVHSIGVSVEELWGEGRKTSSLVFTDPSGQEFMSPFKPLASVTSAVTSRMRRSIWRHFFSALSIAPGPVLLSVVFIFVRSATMLSLISLLCIFIERIFAPTQAILAYKINSPSLQMPELILHSLSSVSKRAPALVSVMDRLVHYALRMFSRYRPALPILMMTTGPLLVELYLRPKLKGYLRQSLSYDHEDLTDVSIVWNFCIMVGNSLTFLILAILSTALKLKNFRKSCMLIFALSLIELLLLKDIRDSDSPDLYHSLLEAQDRRSHIAHLESIVGRKESLEYIQRWSLQHAVEDLVVSMKSSLRKLNQDISRRLPNYNLSLIRRLLFSILALYYCADSHTDLSDDNLLLNNRIVTEKLVNVVRCSYYGYGIEVYEEDDSRLHRHFLAMLTIIGVFLPLQLLTSTFNSCTDLTQAVTERAKVTYIRSPSSYGEPSTNQGWTTGAISSAGVILDAISLHENGIYNIQVRFHRKLLPSFGLQNLSAQIKPGQITAICGDRNSGRNELVDLLRGKNRQRKEGSLNILGREISEWDLQYLQSRVVFIGRNERRLGIRAGDFAGLFLSRTEEVKPISFLANTINKLACGVESVLSYTEDPSCIAESLTVGGFQ